MKIWLISFSILLLFITGCTKSEDNNLNPTEPAEPTTEEILLKLVNDARTAGCNCGNTPYPPVPAVTWNNLLENAAKAHSDDMNNNSRFSHQGSDGSTAGERITRAGYNWRTYGENIARGYPDEEAVINGWLASDGHCQNIMSANFTEMAVAKSGSYWTQVLAKAR